MKCALDELMKLDEKNDTPDVVRDTLEPRGGERDACSFFVLSFLSGNLPRNYFLINKISK